MKGFFATLGVLCTLASLGISIWAVETSRGASSTAIKASNRANQIAAEQLDIHQKELARSGPQLDVTTSVWVTVDGQNDQYFGASNPTIDDQTWQDASGRWAIAELRDPGTQDFVISRATLGVTKESVADPDEVWCKSPGGGWIQCLNAGKETTLAAGHDMQIAFYLNDSLVSNISQDWRSTGIEMCIFGAADAGAKCEAAAVTLPDDAFGQPPH